MLVTPLDDDDVLSTVPDDVGALVVVAALVLELDLVTWALGAVDAYVHDVVAWRRRVSKSKVGVLRSNYRSQKQMPV